MKNPRAPFTDERARDLRIGETTADAAFTEQKLFPSGSFWLIFPFNSMLSVE
jgi:hypothetical protein